MCEAQKRSLSVATGLHVCVTCRAFAVPITPSSLSFSSPAATSCNFSSSNCFCSAATDGCIAVETVRGILQDQDSEGALVHAEGREQVLGRQRFAPSWAVTCHRYRAPAQPCTRGKSPGVGCRRWRCGLGVESASAQSTPRVPTSFPGSAPPRPSAWTAGSLHGVDRARGPAAQARGRCIGTALA